MPPKTDKEAQKKKRALAKALVEAAKAGDLGGVKAILAEGAHPDDVPAKGKRTALIHAAEEGHLSIVQHLREAGADVNAATRDGKAALRLAARGRHPRIVEYLLQRGADPNQLDFAKSPPLMEALDGPRRGDPECVALLLKAGADPDALPRGLDPAKRAPRPYTPLQSAMFQGHVECVAILLDADADPRLGTRRQGLRTPLEMAKSFAEGTGGNFSKVSQKRQRAIAKLFEERGLLPEKES